MGVEGASSAIASDRAQMVPDRVLKRRGTDIRNHLSGEIVKPRAQQKDGHGNAGPRKQKATIWGQEEYLRYAESSNGMQCGVLPTTQHLFPATD